MSDARDAGTALARLLARLEKRHIARQSPATGVLDNRFFGLRDFESTSYAPPTTGHSRLIDGTVIHVAGSTSIGGDPIVTTMRVRGRSVFIDAVGVAAVRLDERGQLEALAAGGFKRLEVGDLAISLDERVDFALWTDRQGQWQGVLQGEGPVPQPLMRITGRWSRLRVPVPAEAK